MGIMSFKTLVVVLVVATVAGGVWYGRQAAEGPPMPAYDTAEVRRGTIRALVSATGTLNPVNTVQVGSQVSGTIQHLYADFNDRVEKGQVIARIDPAIFSAKLAEAAANVKNTEAARDKAEVEVRNTRRELERQSDLFQRALVAESILDAARFAHEAAVMEHRLREAAVAQAEAVRRREEVNLAYTTIRAPIDGVVISRDVDVGQTVAASLQAPTLYTIAQDLTRMQVEADVDEAFVGQVEPGQPVSFTVFAYAERTFAGRVAQLRLQPTVEAGVVSYNCIIQVDNPDLALKPGMTATVAIEAVRRDDVLLVPGRALRFVPEWPEEGLAAVRAEIGAGQGILWQVGAAGLTPVTVTAGIVGERDTEVWGEGIAAGMVVAVPEGRKRPERRRAFGLSLF